MTGLENENATFILLSSRKLNDIISILYAKEYQVTYIKSFYKEQYEDCIMAYAKVDNDTLRSDVLFILEYFDETYAIIKYSGEEMAKNIFKDGSETPLKIVMYNTDENNISYINNGISFSFVESVRYWIPTKKEDFKEGMIIEYFNNNEWNQKSVGNVNEEYEKLYKLLIKYNKIRAISK